MYLHYPRATRLANQLRLCDLYFPHAVSATGE